MQKYSQERFEKFPDIDGFILKGRSPSCGIKDVKVYTGMEKSPVIEKREGVFAREVFKKFSYLPIEEEGRLTNLSIREHFFTKLYVIFNFKNMAKNNSFKDLINFHAKNKYLYFAYNQAQSSVLKSYSIKYNIEYLLDQSIFSPFPDELVILDDSARV